ncbi:MAG: hypothetical protein HYZ29_07580 [Myxococcales bacterium]|nr:hypothetical protein [Myxococcales bacterium]
MAGLSFVGAAKNPFCAARFAPGALPWIGDDLDALAGRALVPGARHQIVGSHGSGKSTLLVELERRARRQGWSVLRVRGSRGLGPRSRADLLLVDEYEELSVWGRLRVRRWAGAVVVSAHRDVGLPTLCQRQASVALAEAIVARLAAGTDVVPPSAGELGALLGRHAGNVREVLFELYDQVERQCRSGPACR